MVVLCNHGVLEGGEGFLKARGEGPKGEDEKMPDSNLVAISIQLLRFSHICSYHVSISSYKCLKRLDSSVK